MSFYTEVKDVNSSSIKTVYYDAIAQEMFVEFHNGNYAGYSGVSPVTYKDLLNAPSVGKFYNSWIRGAYNGTAVSGLEKRPDIVSNVVNIVQDSSTKVGASVSMFPAKSVYRDYTVRGYVLVEETYNVSSPEEAVAEFEQDYTNATIKEVVVSFE